MIVVSPTKKMRGSQRGVIGIQSRLRLAKTTMAIIPQFYNRGHEIGGSSLIFDVLHTV